QYGTTVRQGNLRRIANPSVTAGLMCPPLMPWETYTPNTTARNQPQVTTSQPPAPTKNVVAPSVRPLPARPTTATATDPHPNNTSTAVPRNSARHSPHRLSWNFDRRRLAKIGVMSSAAIAMHLLYEIQQRNGPFSCTPAPVFWHEMSHGPQLHTWGGRGRISPSRRPRPVRRSSCSARSGRRSPQGWTSASNRP